MKRVLAAWGLCAFAACLVACQESSPEAPKPSRFAGVKKQAQAGATGAARFCDQLHAAKAAEAPAYRAPPTRPLPKVEKGSATGATGTGKGWRWINAWATWCTPCIDEMGLLGRWRDAFVKDGLDVRFELLSIDSPDAEPELQKWLGRNLPGTVQWIRGEDDFGPWLDGLGLDRNAAIPIHVLVDPQEKVRCVRVGAVHEQDYGAIRAMLVDV